MQQLEFILTNGNYQRFDYHGRARRQHYQIGLRTTGTTTTTTTTQNPNDGRIIGNDRYSGQGGRIIDMTRGASLSNSNLGGEVDEESDMSTRFGNKNVFQNKITNTEDRNPFGDFKNPFEDKQIGFQNQFSNQQETKQINSRFDTFGRKEKTEEPKKEIIVEYANNGVCNLNQNTDIIVMVNNELGLNVCNIQQDFVKELIYQIYISNKKNYLRVGLISFGNCETTEMINLKDNSDLLGELGSINMCGNSPRYVQDCSICSDVFSLGMDGCWIRNT